MGYIYSTIKAKIEEEARSFECISSRYGLPFCLMLIYHEGDEDISQTIISNTRCADRFKKIDNNYYALLFFANNPESHVKLANKIMYVLERANPQKKISIGVACKERLDSEDIVLKALQNVLEAKKAPNNTIVDNF